MKTANCADSARVQSSRYTSCSYLQTSRGTAFTHNHRSRNCAHPSQGVFAGLPPRGDNKAAKEIKAMRSTDGSGYAQWTAEPEHLIFRDYSELLDPEDSDSDDSVDLAVSLAEYIAEVSDQFGIDDFIDIQPGRGGFPVVYLSHPSGHSAHIDLLGANITSLQRPSGEELLFPPSRAAAMAVHDHARYGMQPVFPVLGQAPAVLASHDFLLPPTGGLLNSQHWSVVGSEADLNPDCPQLSVVLATEADEDTLEIWPHDFQATLAVQMLQVAKPKTGQQLSASQPPVELRCRLSIHNRGECPMAFTAGLQTCLALPEHERAELYNLPWGGVVLKQDSRGAAALVEDTMDRCLPLSGCTYDRVYVGARHLSFHPGTFLYRVEVVNRGGFSDIGVRKTCEDCVALPQGALVEPIRLAAGAIWEGESVLIVHELIGERGGKPSVAPLE